MERCGNPQIVANRRIAAPDHPRAAASRAKIFAGLTSTSVAPGSALPLHGCSSSCRPSSIAIGIPKPRYASRSARLPATRNELLLMAVDGVAGVFDVEHDGRRLPPIALAELVNHRCSRDRAAPGHQIDPTCCVGLSSIHPTRCGAPDIVLHLDRAGLSIAQPCPFYL